MNWILYIQAIFLLIVLYIVISALIEKYFTEVRKTEIEVGKALSEANNRPFI